MNHLEQASRSGMRSLRAWVAPCTAATLLALAGCTQTEPDAGARGNESIRLTGRVVGNNNTPVAGVAVSLSRIGLTDTTDALGRYVITRKKAADETDDVVLDTLRYSMGGQALARVNVMQWIDELPDIQVIQRDISGLLDTEGLTATRIEGVLTGDGIDAENPVTAEFYYNALTGNYSGFLFFPPATSVAQYSVQINVYGADDVLIGQSAPVPFNSFAGNITVPAFTAGNSVPVVSAGQDTAVAPGATVNLRGTASDAFGGSIVKWEWSIAGSPFVETSGADTTFSRATPGAYVNVLRVTDDDGNVAVDTMIAHMASHGATWVTRTAGTTISLNDVVWAGTQFVAVGHGGHILRSPDGVTWTTHIPDSSMRSGFSHVVWTGKKLIATAVTTQGPPVYYSSTDGIEWSQGELPWIILGPGMNIQVSVADTTVLVSTTHTRFLARSEDHGVTWIVDSLPENTHEWDGPIYGLNAYTRHAGRLVGVGSNGMTASSSGDGIWTRHTNSGSFPRPHGGVYDYTMQAVVSTGTHAVAVGYAGHVMRSLDGTSWLQPRVAGGIPQQEGGSSKGHLFDVIWTGEVLVAVGTGYHLLSADGGANWSQIVLGEAEMTALAWNGTRLVAVGPMGRIITSP